MHSKIELEAQAAALRFAHENGYPERERKLPRGRRENPEKCPLALAIGGMVASSCWWPDTGRDGLSKGRQSLPSLVEKFVRLVDDGRFPELAERNT